MIGKMLFFAREIPDNILKYNESKAAADYQDHCHDIHDSIVSETLEARPECRKTCIAE